MTDDVFRSMKAQMEPSDQVVSDLLAVIAAEQSSPVTPASNVVSLSKAKAVKEASAESDVTKAKTSKKRRPIWYYGTAAAASVLVLVSTFLLLESSGGMDNSNTLKNLFDSMIHPNSGYNDGETIIPPISDDETDFPLDADEVLESIENGDNSEKDNVIVVDNNATNINTSVNNNELLPDNSINSLPDYSDSANSDNGKITQIGRASCRERV